jgi:hypothetical protein
VPIGSLGVPLRACDPQDVSELPRFWIVMQVLIVICVIISAIITIIKL